MKKLFIVFAILCLAAPAMAADWNFYGSSRFATFYVMDDYDVDGAQYEDDADLEWAAQGNSRIGANVKVNDQIGGGFEVSQAFSTRKLFGTYTFGGGSQLMIGQNYAPSAWFYSNSVYAGDGDLLGIGEFYEGRNPMIQWKMGGLKVALIQPTWGNSNVGDPAVDSYLPKIEVGYGLKGDAFFLDAFGGYQAYTLDGGNGGTDFDIDSYVVGVGGGMNFGALFFKVGGHYGNNLGDYGAAGPPVGDPDTSAIIVGTEVKDTTGYGVLGVLGFNMSEMLTFEAGIGYQNYEKDIDNTDDETYMQYYLNATVNIAPGFFIVPEIGYITIDEDNTGQATDPNPSRLYLGAKWQINF